MLQTRIDRLQGADSSSLENKVRQYYGTEEAGDEDNSVAGHVSYLLFLLISLYHSLVQGNKFSTSCVQSWSLGLWAI